MMALPALIALPLFGGGVAWISGLRGSTLLPRLAAILTMLLLMLDAGILTTGTIAGPWRAEYIAQWIPILGIKFRLDMDGLSLVMLWLNLVISGLCVILPTRHYPDRTGFLQFLILATVGAVNGVFLATDLFTFFFFWELMLLPMLAIVLIWGDANRIRATLKFFLFTQCGGLIMLLSIVALVFVNEQRTGAWTFDYFELATTAAVSPYASVIMLGFFLAFAVKLPMFPLHTWLPDAYSSAPMVGSVLFAGILAKTAGYGLIRFVWLLFPNSAILIAPLAMTLGVIGVLYCAWLAFAQSDLKRLIAYSSISHLGFVLLGIFSGTEIGMRGAIVQMVAHGLSITGLFVVAGFLEERLGTLDMRKMGGLWPALPGFSALALFFVIASLGLPGLGNFVGEFLTLMGLWQVSHVLTFFAAAGLVLSSVYALTLMLRVFYGPTTGEMSLGKASLPCMTALSVAAVLLLALGLYPQPLINHAVPALPYATQELQTR